MIRGKNAFYFTIQYQSSGQIRRQRDQYFLTPIKSLTFGMAPLFFFVKIEGS